MRFFTLLFFGLSVLPAAAAIASTPAAAVTLVASPAINSQIAALPRIADPTPAERSINRGLAQADASVRGSCDGWQRTVQVVMRGAGYLSVVASDNWYCDGDASPGSDSFGLAYDLHTGSPLNWARLLPKALVQSTILDYSGDGLPLGVVFSPALTALYMKLAQPNIDPSCVPELQQSPFPFMLWPDAKADGVVLNPDGLAHAIAACGPQETIPLATLRQIGVSPTLLDAIAAAHQAGEFDTPKD